MDPCLGLAAKAGYSRCHHADLQGPDLIEQEGEDRVTNPRTETLWPKNSALAWREIEWQTVISGPVLVVKEELLVEWF